MVGENIKDESIHKVVVDSCAVFGDYVNNKRHVPSVHDGLKPVYRRVIYAAMKLGGTTNKFIKTARLVGDVIGKYHAHGDVSVADVVTELVNYRIFDGQGNFGDKPIYGEDSPAAAMRYTEVRINQNWFNFFSELLEFVPYVESDTGTGDMEPVYLPTPFPICMALGLFGIGFGLISRLPSFSIPSMLEAMQDDDYELLEPYYNLEIRKEMSEVEDVWYGGVGRIAYAFKVFRGGSKDGGGIYIEGDTNLFTPDLEFAQLDRLVKSQRVYIRDESDATGSRVFIGANDRVRVDMDMLVDKIRYHATNTEVYRLHVSDGKCVRNIPLKEWLQYTYANYKRLINLMKEQTIPKLEFQKSVYLSMRNVAQLLLKDASMSADKMAQELKVPVDVVKECLQKTLSVLQKTNAQSKIASLDAEISRLKNLDPDARILEIVHGFE